MYFSGTKGKREILTPELAMALFREPWRNETSKLANLLAMCTGLRAGEIQALRKKTLGETAYMCGIHGLTKMDLKQQKIMKSEWQK